MLSMRRNFCQACAFNRHGVRHRLECVCGQNVPPKKSEPYVPTREELDKYLSRLRDFWDEENQCWLDKPKEVSLDGSDIAALQAKQLSNGNSG